MIAVGVDVSNGRSTVAALDHTRKIILKPFEVRHTSEGFADLVKKLETLGKPITIVLEHTGRYY